MSEADSVTIACPQCGKRYHVARSSAGKRARCACGLQFQVPASISPPASVADVPLAQPAGAVPPSPVAVGHCGRHPGVLALFTCAGCGTPMCKACATAQSDGRHFCASCASGQQGDTYATADDSDDTYGLADDGETYAISEPEPRVASSPFIGASSSAAIPSPVLGQCQRHPEIGAVARCGLCKTPVCSTCVFEYPSGKYCPACVLSPPRALSPSRKFLVFTSLGLAVWCTLAMVLVFGGAVDGMPDVVVGLITAIPSVVGFSMAFGTIDMRAGNTVAVWVTVGWNGILGAVWLLLIIVGSMMGAA